MDHTSLQLRNWNTIIISRGGAEWQHLLWDVSYVNIAVWTRKQGQSFLTHQHLSVSSLLSQVIGWILLLCNSANPWTYRTNHPTLWSMFNSTIYCAIFCFMNIKHSFIGEEWGIMSSQVNRTSQNNRMWTVRQGWVLSLSVVFHYMTNCGSPFS